MFRSVFEIERDGQVVRAVVAALRGHVEHALDAIDLLLDWGGNRIADDLGAGAGISARYLYGRRRDGRILGDGQGEHGDRPGQSDDDGNHRRKNGPVYEKVGYHGNRN